MRFELSQPGTHVGKLLFVALACLVLSTGCRRPFRAITESILSGQVQSSVQGTVNSNVTGNVNSQVDLNVPSPVIDSGPLQEMLVDGTANQSGKIALIDVDGLMVNKDLTGFFSVGENPVSVFREKLNRVAADKNFRAVVLRINSPGGGVTASDIMLRDLKTFQEKTKIPVVACLMDVSTGGAYYLASGADYIIGHPTTVTGGMGVIMNLYYMEDMMAQMNIVGVPIKAGENIDLGSPITMVPEGGRELLQQIANDFHERFKAVVTNGRPNAKITDEVFDGRIFTAGQAEELKLIDSTGYLDDAMRVARNLGNSSDAAVVMLHRPKDVARSQYAISPNTPMQSTFIPLSVPGLERSKLPTFMYLWQPNPSLETIGG